MNQIQQISIWNINWYTVIRLLFLQHLLRDLFCQTYRAGLLKVRPIVDRRACRYGPPGTEHQISNFLGKYWKSEISLSCISLFNLKNIGGSKWGPNCPHPPPPICIRLFCELFHTVMHKGGVFKLWFWKLGVSKSGSLYVLLSNELNKTFNIFNIGWL